VYGIQWTNEAIFLIDGIVNNSFINQGRGNSVWPFDKPFHFVLNVAIGGTLGGTIDYNSFPQSMDIEWVRVFQ